MNRKYSEAIRYLGYGRHAVDEKTLELVNSSFKELEARCREDFIYRIFDLHLPKEDVLQIGQWSIESKNLYKNMKGCDQIVVFAATLGLEVDRLLRRYSVTNMAQAVVLQACAAAHLEEYCDRMQGEIGRELETKQRYLRPRFSPGYGDFDIKHQRTLLEILNANKTIGVTMTESCMLMPSKSVTALIGASTTKEPCHRLGCESCEKTDCLYRR